MTRSYVLDANAVLDLLQGGQGSPRVKQLLAAALLPATAVLISVLNLGEVLYVLWQHQGEEAAKRAIASLSGLPLQTVAVDLGQSFQAAELRARHKIPYVDCIAAALAIERQATLVTSDRDFEKLGRRIHCPVVAALAAPRTVSPDARIAAMPKRQSAQTRARKIKLLLFDVDGVLTDGKLFIFPAPPGIQQTALDRAPHRGPEDRGGFAFRSETLIEAKGFHAHDGTAISLARLGGIQTGLITKRISETVALRARDLKLEHVHQGIEDKLGVFRQILQQEGLSPEQGAFVGDDVIDLPVMWHCGFAVAVANARAEVKRGAHYVTPHSGGDGALRDAVEFILKAQGKWKQAVESYIGERSR